MSVDVAVTVTAPAADAPGVTSMLSLAGLSSALAAANIRGNASFVAAPAAPVAQAAAAPPASPTSQQPAQAAAAPPQTASAAPPPSTPPAVIALGAALGGVVCLFSICCAVDRRRLRRALDAAGLRKAGAAVAPRARLTALIGDEPLCGVAAACFPGHARAAQPQPDIFLGTAASEDDALESHDPRARRGRRAQA